MDTGFFVLWLLTLSGQSRIFDSSKRQLRLFKVNITHKYKMKLFSFISANKGMSSLIAGLGAVGGVAFAATLRKLPLFNKLPNK